MLCGTTPALQVAALDGFTKLLLHFESTKPASTLIYDSTGLHGNAAVAGTLQTGADATGAMNYRSLYFNGGANWCSFPNHADFDFGAGDFTVDWWDYRFDTSDSRPVLTRNGTVAQTYQPFMFGYSTGGIIYSYASNDNATWNILNALSMGTFTANTWHHFALVRKGNTFYAFKDGVLQNTATSALAFPAGTGQLAIGFWNYTTPFYFYGYIDELRISKGIARWTANFPLPTQPYGPDAQKDWNTVLLLHGDGANGSAVFSDASPGLHGNATIGGTVTVSTAQSKFGGGSIFNQGYLGFTAHSDFNFLAEDFTIDWWEYRTGTGCSIARDLGTTYCPFLLSFSSAGEIYMTSTGNTWDIANGSGGLPAPAFGPSVMNGWSHLAVTRSGSTFRAFRDGVQKSTWTSAAAIIANGNALCLMAAQNGQNMQGYMDEVRISKGIARWTANFTPPTMPYLTDPVAYSTKLLMHFDANPMADSSSFNRGNVAIFGTGVGPTGAQAKFGPCSCVFPGVNQYLQYPDSPDWAFGSSDFTIDLWFNRSGGDGTNRGLFGQINSGLTDNSCGCMLSTANTIQFYWGITGSDWGSQGVFGSTTITTAGWHHLALVRSASTLTLFLDGVADATATITGAIFNSSSPFTIGCLGGYPAYWNGYIDELRISNGVARWTANFTPPNAPYQ